MTDAPLWYRTAVIKKMSDLQPGDEYILPDVVTVTSEPFWSEKHDRWVVEGVAGEQPRTLMAKTDGVVVARGV